MAARVYIDKHGAWTKKNDVICVSFNRSQSTTNEYAHRSHVIV